MKKYLSITLIIITLMLILTGCFGSNTPSPDNLDDVVITLERTVCFGACPVYKLTVYGTGEVVYQGIDFVRIEGTVTSTISQDKVQQLVAEFQKIDYFSLDDSYEEFMATDLPYANTSITINGETKAIRHYHGDFSAPEELTQLEDSIDEIVATDQWVKLAAD